MTGEQLVVGQLEPVAQRDPRRRIGLERRASRRRSRVPGAHVLADVAAVHTVVERGRMRVRDRVGSLRRRRQARARIEHARLDQRSGRARVQAQRAAPHPGGTRSSAGSSSRSVTSAPSATNEPSPGTIAIVFRPENASPERTAASRSTWWFESTKTAARAPCSARSRAASDSSRVRSGAYGSCQAYRGIRPTRPVRALARRRHSGSAAAITERAPRTSRSGWHERAVLVSVKRRSPNRPRARRSAIADSQLAYASARATPTRRPSSSSSDARSTDRQDRPRVSGVSGALN